MGWDGVVGCCLSLISSSCGCYLLMTRVAVVDLQHVGAPSTSRMCILGLKKEGLSWLKVPLGRCGHAYCSCCYIGLGFADMASPVSGC